MWVGVMEQVGVPSSQHAKVSDVVSDTFDSDGVICIHEQSDQASGNSDSGCGPSMLTASSHVGGT